MARKIRQISDTETLWVLDDGERHMIVRSRDGLVLVSTSMPDGFEINCEFKGWNAEFYPHLSADDGVAAELDKFLRDSEAWWSLDTLFGTRARYEAWKATQQ